MFCTALTGLRTNCASHGWQQGHTHQHHRTCLNSTDTSALITIGDTDALSGRNGSSSGAAAVEFSKLPAPATPEAAALVSSSPAFSPQLFFFHDRRRGRAGATAPVGVLAVIRVADHAVDAAEEEVEQGNLLAARTKAEQARHKHTSNTNPSGTSKLKRRITARALHRGRVGAALGSTVGRLDRVHITPACPSVEGVSWDHTWCVISKFPNVGRRAVLIPKKTHATDNRGVLPPEQGVRSAEYVEAGACSPILNS